MLKYYIKQGDSLHLIAQNLLGSSERAMELATLNDLDYPFISDERIEGKNVLIPGDLLEIPVSTQEQIDNQSTNSDYGRDLLLDNTDSSLTNGSGGEFTTDLYGDLSVVHGIDCLKQDLRHRLMTEEGSLPYHPEYGSRLHLLLGSKNDTTTQQKVLIEVCRCFLSDPRVLNVDKIETNVVGSSIYVTGTIITQPFYELKVDEVLRF